MECQDWLKTAPTRFFFYHWPLRLNNQPYPLGIFSFLQISQYMSVCNYYTFRPCRKAQQQTLQSGFSPNTWSLLTFTYEKSSPNSTSPGQRQRGVVEEEDTDRERDKKEKHVPDREMAKRNKTVLSGKAHSGRVKLWSNQDEKSVISHIGFVLHRGIENPQRIKYCKFFSLLIFWDKNYIHVNCHWNTSTKHI